MTRVLFVCLGNICRSPTAEAVFRTLARRAGLAVQVASAGTSAAHAGEGADPRTIEHARRRGYDLSNHRARQVRAPDFGQHDLLFAMDLANLAALERLCPPSTRGKVRLFLDLTPEAGTREVPDPWDGGDEGFERVLDLVEGAAGALVRELRREAA